MGKPIDYKSILCSEFGCSRFDLGCYVVIDPVENAMKEAVRQVSENYIEEINSLNQTISILENDL